VLVFRCLHGTAPAHLADEIRRVTDSDSKRLRSASTSALVVPPTRRMTIGDRVFPVAGARVWNAFSSFVTDSAIVTIFKRYLKTPLYEISVLTRHNCCGFVALLWLRSVFSKLTVGCYDTVIIIIHVVMMMRTKMLHFCHPDNTTMFRLSHNTLKTLFFVRSYCEKTLVIFSAFILMLCV